MYCALCKLLQSVSLSVHRDERSISFLSFMHVSTELNPQNVPFFSQVHEIFHHDHNIYIVMEYCRGGPLLTSKVRRLSEAKTAIIMGKFVMILTASLEASKNIEVSKFMSTEPSEMFCFRPDYCQGRKSKWQ
jgi:serine/threonine protein kinase